jgi:hypothetical protein
VLRKQRVAYYYLKGAKRMKIIALDPGEHTGWMMRDHSGKLTGGTVPKYLQSDGSLDKDMHLIQVIELLDACSPDLVVIERFNLYPGMAKSLSWNSFFPCEVIGAVRLWCKSNNVKIVEQAPSIKKYAGPFQDDWDDMKRRCAKDVTEHTKDAYQHLRYYERYSLKGK